MIIHDTDSEKVIFIDDKALNEAKWAACNTWFEDEQYPPSMEDVSHAVENAIIAYLEVAVGYQ